MWEGRRTTSSGDVGGQRDSVSYPNLRGHMATTVGPPESSQRWALGVWQRGIGEQRKLEGKKTKTQGKVWTHTSLHVSVCRERHSQYWLILVGTNSLGAPRTILSDTMLGLDATMLFWPCATWPCLGVIQKQELDLASCTLGKCFTTEVSSTASKEIFLTYRVFHFDSCLLGIVWSHNIILLWWLDILEFETHRCDHLLDLPVDYATLDNEFTWVWVPQLKNSRKCTIPKVVARINVAMCKKCSMQQMLSEIMIKNRKHARKGNAFQYQNILYELFN